MAVRSAWLVVAGATVMWGTAVLAGPARPATGDAGKRATALAVTLRPGYTPWVRPVFEPGEAAEARLFLAQSAAGTTLFVGVLVATRRRSRS